MALRFIEGFDDNLTGQRGWIGAVPAAGTGRFGGAAANPAYYTQVSYYLPSPISGTVVVGLAIKFANNNGYGPAIAVGPIGIQKPIAGNVQVYNTGNGTVYGTSGNAPFSAPNVWRYVELKYNTTTGAATVRVDGISVITATTITTTSVPLITMGYSGGNSGDLTFDDLYVLDGTGTVNNDFLGDVRVQTLYASSDGSNSQLTPSTGTTHYNLVNEATPDTTSYVSSSTAGQKDTYQFQDLASNTKNVFGVEITNYAHKDAAGPAAFSNIARVGATDYVQTAQPLSTSWTANRDLLEINPATGLPWAPSDINSAEFGVQVS
jgi:hypothetical protein